MMFEFADLIAEYSVPITIYPPDANEPGHYDEETGEWIDPKPADPINAQGALIPYSNDQLYQSGGRLTEYDRQLLINMDIKSKTVIVSKGQKYSIENIVPYSDYADFNQYECKWVDAFE